VPLDDFLSSLDRITAEARSAFDGADSDALEAARVEFLGARSGRLKQVQKGLGKVDKADKPAAGKAFNAAKTAIEAAFETAQRQLASGVTTTTEGPQFDLTLPGVRPRLGRVHPITRTISDLQEIMGRLGFSVTEGPEVEDEWHNFEALNIPSNHPARDPLENFYLATANKSAPDAAGSTGDAKPLLLRSQTSTVQIRVMEKTQPPVRIISVGRVYRPDTADATHYPMFHQVEGLLVDRDVTMADLKSVLRLFAQSYFAAGDTHIRFRPSFFPFTEPSVEVDMSWQGGWMEMGGAGMIDPNVLRAVGYDPEVYSGFAFGLGVERICMGRHGITDIRELYKNDVRFLRQL
jgi:phenylalanyl-tRNA synthetase alpha chain